MTALLAALSHRLRLLRLALGIPSPSLAFAPSLAEDSDLGRREAALAERWRAANPLPADGRPPWMTAEAWHDAGLSDAPATSAEAGGARAREGGDVTTSTAADDPGRADESPITFAPDLCAKPLECGGECAKPAGHEPPCRCPGDDGDGCPA